MNKKLLLNILINTVLAVVFVMVCNTAVIKGYEESFIAYSIIYSMIVIVVNALLVKNQK